MAAANPMSRNAGSSSFYINVNYQEESEKISDFLQKFEVTEETLAGRRRQRVAVKKYLKQLVMLLFILIYLFTLVTQ